MFTVFLVEESCPAAMSLMKKLSDIKHGQLILVTQDEMEAWMSGKVLPVTLLDYTPSKAIEDQPPQETHPESPVS